MSRRNRKSAFTLVELLVVISIVALLVSLLLPALGQVKEQARRSACLSQLRQIMLAASAYVSDSRGTLPPGAFKEAYGVTESPLDPSWPAPWGWSTPDDEPAGFHRLAKYVSSYELWFCPSMTNPSFTDRQKWILPNGQRASRGGYGWRSLDENDRTMYTVYSPQRRLRPLARPDEGQRRTGLPTLSPSRTAYTGDLVLNYVLGVSPSIMSECHFTGYHAVYMDGHAAWRDNANDHVLEFWGVNTHPKNLDIGTRYIWDKR